MIFSKNVDVNDRWVYAFQNMGDYSSLWGKEPQKFTFRGDRAVIPARENEVQQIIDHFKDWMPKANKRYEELLLKEMGEQQARERRKLEAEIVANEARARLKKRIKL